MAKVKRQPISREQVDEAFRQFGMEGARECDKQVIQMTGGTTDELRDMMHDHWGFPLVSVDKAIRVAIGKSK